MFSIINHFKQKKKEKNITTANSNTEIFDSVISIPNNLLPEEINKQKIICLDFDDCIIPPRDMLIHSDTQKLFKKVLTENVEDIIRICKQYNFFIFITSSWSEFLEIDLKEKSFFIKEKKDLYTKNVLPLIQPLACYTIGMSPYGDREEDIKTLQKQNNLIVIIDDMDLSFLENKTTKYCFVPNGKLNIKEIEKTVLEII